MKKASRKEKDMKKQEADKKQESREKESLESVLREQGQDKQIKTILILMALLIIAIFLVSWFVKESKKFEYSGVKFEKIMFGELPLYYARIPITTMTGELIANYNLYLRNDPRKLNISIEGKIELKNKVIIAVNKSMPECQYAGVAGVNLGQFLRAAGIEHKDGATDIEEAEEKGVEFASCDNKEASVLIVTEGDETKIIREEENCYIIEVANCEVLPAVERFVIGAIAHSRGYDI